MRDIAPQIKDRLYYQIPQLQDTATYYVKAVVKDLISGTVLGTYELDALGNQAFAKDWMTPVDNTGGNGRTLVVTFTVYDDAGYTTPSMNYGAKAEYFRVIQPWNPMISGGGSGFVSGFREEDKEYLTKQKDESRKELLDDNKKHRESISKEISDLREELHEFIEQITGVSMDMDKKSSEKFTSISEQTKKSEELHGHALSTLHEMVMRGQDERREQAKEFDGKMMEHSTKLEEKFMQRFSEMNQEMRKDFNTQINAFFQLIDRRLGLMEEKMIENDPKEIAKGILKKMLNGDLSENKKVAGLSEMLNES